MIYHINIGQKNPYMTSQNIALVSTSNQISQSDLANTAAALQLQIKDLQKVWGVDGTISYFPDINDIPFGYWRIIVADNINQPNEEGFHLTQLNQPYAMVHADAQIWQITCSHEMCEMLVDPIGNQLRKAAGVDIFGGLMVSYLLEICDPCQHSDNSYLINGIPVCDFYTPNFFDASKRPGVSYSNNGSIIEPLQIVNGGYVSFIDPSTNQWYRTFNINGELKTTEAPVGNSGSLRIDIDRVPKNPALFAQHGILKEEHIRTIEMTKKATAHDAARWKNEISKYIK